MKQNRRENGRLYTPEYSHVPSQRAFKEVLAGKTRTKPKFLLSPKQDALYRLVIPEQGQAPFYEALPLEPEVIYHLELGEQAMAQSRSKQLPQLPAGYAIHSFRSQTKTPKECATISFGQLHAVLSALSRPYRWSLTELANKEALAPLVVNLLYKENKIVGACAWNKAHHRRKGKPGGIAFYLVAPEERGHGLGKHLLEFTQQQMLAGGVGSVQLSTSDSCTDSKNSCVTDFYQRQGYEITGEYYFDPAYLHEAEELPACVPEQFYRHPATGEELPRFQKARLDEQLSRVSRELLAPSRGR